LTCIVKQAAVFERSAVQDFELINPAGNPAASAAGGVRFVCPIPQVSVREQVSSPKIRAFFGIPNRGSE